MRGDLLRSSVLLIKTEMLRKKYGLLYPHLEGPDGTAKPGELIPCLWKNKQKRKELENESDTISRENDRI